MATGGARYAASRIENMLECCVCLDVVEDPHTLQECLHTLCKSCMQQLLQEQNNHPPGVNCPICRKFSGRDKIMSNFFIKELRDVHKSSQEKKVVCQQCHDVRETVEASCRCLDCRETLCESCKKAHQKIKLLRGHRIVDLTDDQEVVVDRLVWCDIHNDKVVELYCEPCQQLICITCKVTKHNAHKSQTIDEALERILPEMRANAKAIDENIHEIEKSAESVQKKIYETKESFQKCYQEIAATAEARKKEIEVEERKMEADLKRKEAEEISKLEEMQERLELRKKERENTRRVLRGSMDRARHATLLREFVHGGLSGKVRVVRKNPEPALQLKVNKPQFSSNFIEWKNLTKKGLVGNVVYGVMSVVVVDYVLGSALSKVKNVDFSKYFSQTFNKEVKIIQLNGYCSKITIINDFIWAPLNNQNKVFVLNKNGNLEKTIEIDKPISVAQADNGDVLIACSTGLYIMTEDDTPQRINTGSFADVYSHAGKVFALEYESKTIEEYLPAGSAHSSSRDVKLRWKTGRHWKIDQKTTQSDKLVVTGGDELQFFVSHQTNHIREYNTQGRCVKQFGGQHERGAGNLGGPWLCGVDRYSNLLVADHCNNVYKILDPGTGQWRLTGVRRMQNVCDAKIDSDENLWLCLWDGKNHMITKNESQ